MKYECCALFYLNLFPKQICECLKSPNKFTSFQFRQKSAKNNFVVKFVDTSSYFISNVPQILYINRYVKSKKSRTIVINYLRV